MAVCSEDAEMKGFHLLLFRDLCYLWAGYQHDGLHNCTVTTGSERVPLLTWTASFCCCSSFSRQYSLADSHYMTFTCACHDKNLTLTWSVTLGLRGGWQLTADCNFSSKGEDALLWPLWAWHTGDAPDIHEIKTHTHSCTHKYTCPWRGGQRC